MQDARCGGVHKESLEKAAVLRADVDICRSQILTPAFGQPLSLRKRGDGAKLVLATRFDGGDDHLIKIL